MSDQTIECVGCGERFGAHLMTEAEDGDYCDDCYEYYFDDDEEDVEDET